MSDLGLGGAHVEEQEKFGQKDEMEVGSHYQNKSKRLL